MKNKKSPADRDPAELELATMRQCLKLIRRLERDGRHRCIAYLASAAAPYEPSGVPGPSTRQEELPLS